MTRVRVALVDRADQHTVQYCLAPDTQTAGPMVAAYMALGGTVAGRWEVVLRVVEYVQHGTEGGDGE
jgi:hypothetical protein